MSVNMMSKNAMRSACSARTPSRSLHVAPTSRTPLPTSGCVQPSLSRPLTISCRAAAQAAPVEPIKAESSLPNTKPSAAILKFWQTADCVCFDVDCTLVKNDGLDVLAEFLGVGEAVEASTHKAMDGTMSLDESLKERLDIINCTPADIRAFLAANPPESRINPGSVELINALKKRNIPVYLLTGGFREILNPIAQYLGIPDENIRANRMHFQWDEKTLDATKLVGFDKTEPTSRNKGKPEAIAALRKEFPAYKNVVMVGDGVTDLEAVYEDDGADVFIGYGGNMARSQVMAEADWFVYHHDELINALLDH